VLLAAAHLLRARADDIARDLTREMGKTLPEARGEVGKTADFFEYCGGLGRAPVGELLADERPGVRAWTVREPVGVVLAVCPWNDPILTPARKCAPALIAGNAVVLKPASYTPVVSLHLARALADAGLPAGVLNTVTGSARDISAALIANDALAAISFTGSNEVGESIRRDIAGTNIKLLAELGGKNAAVVLSDADLEKATATIATAAFAQAGQRCTATSRVIVARSVLDETLERLTTLADALVLGPGLDVRTTMGPVVAPEQKETVQGFLERAVADGAEMLTGSEPFDDGLSAGCFVRPAVLTVDASAEIWREEIFGPVIAVLAVDDIDEAVSAVNDSSYGLAASIFTTDLGSATRFIGGVAVGQVSVNLPTSGWDVHMPFGGFKASGSGSKEQGLEGLDFYTRTKTVALGL
jgi:aldehyde dehydrogenase (NAD+)